MSRSKIFIEIFGTFFLTLVIAFTGNPFAVGAVFVALVYAGGHISGAHYNPAVSLAQYVAKRITLKELAFYSLSQILGATLAALAFILIVSSPFALSPNPQATNIQVFTAEAIFTFLLAFIVLSVTTKRVKNNQFFGLAIGLTLMAGVFAAGGISGAMLNPAVTFSAVVTNIGSIQANLSYLGLYLAAQLVAGLSAGLVFKLQEK